MEKSRTFTFVLLICSVSSLWAENDKSIIIEDYIVGAVYEVIEVDGAPPERAKHGMFVTVVPFVLVNEGSHRLTVIYNNIKTGQKDEKPVGLTIDVHKGKRYRLVQEDGKPKLVVKNEQ